MGKFSNIIIASDMDGTFLGEKSRIIPENMSAIEYFNQNGGHFTFNTGRGVTAVINRFPEIVRIISAPLGVHNGSCIFDVKNDRPIEEIFIDNGIAQDISDYLLSLSHDIDFTLRTTRNFYSLESMKNGHFKNFVRKFPDYCHVIEREDIKKLDVQKIFFMGEQQIIDKVRADIEKNYSGYIRCTTGGCNYIEIDPPASSKANLIRKLKGILNLPEAKIFAIGDYENDLEMLYAADYAACPENASQAVKQIADITVCHHEKGAIADLIRIIEENYLG